MGRGGPSHLFPQYVLDGALLAPRGTLLQVRTVWIIDAGEGTPQFVTAYPL